MLQKSEIGRSRPGVAKLPGGHFAYGHPMQRDAEGVSEITKSWRAHQGSADVARPTDFRKLNKFVLSKKNSNMQVSQHEWKLKPLMKEDKFKVTSPTEVYKRRLDSVD